MGDARSHSRASFGAARGGGGGGDARGGATPTLDLGPPRRAPSVMRVGPVMPLLHLAPNATATDVTLQLSHGVNLEETQLLCEEVRYRPRAERVDTMRKELREVDDKQAMQAEQKEKMIEFLLTREQATTRYQSGRETRVAAAQAKADSQQAELQIALAALQPSSEAIATQNSSLLTGLQASRDGLERELARGVALDAAIAEAESQLATEEAELRCVRQETRDNLRRARGMNAVTARLKSKLAASASRVHHLEATSQTMSSELAQLTEREHVANENKQRALQKWKEKPEFAHCTTFDSLMAALSAGIDACSSSLEENRVLDQRLQEEIESKLTGGQEKQMKQRQVEMEIHGLQAQIDDPALAASLIPPPIPPLLTPDVRDGLAILAADRPQLAERKRQVADLRQSVEERMAAPRDALQAQIASVEDALRTVNSNKLEADRLKRKAKKMRHKQNQKLAKVKSIKLTDHASLVAALPVAERQLAEEEDRISTVQSHLLSMKDLLGVKISHSSDLPTKLQVAGAKTNLLKEARRAGITDDQWRRRAPEATHETAIPSEEEEETSSTSRTPQLQQQSPVEVATPTLTPTAHQLAHTSDILHERPVRSDAVGSLNVPTGRAYTPTMRTRAESRTQTLSSGPPRHVRTASGAPTSATTTTPTMTRPSRRERAASQ